MERYAPFIAWVKRLGVVGFLFFFLKGMAWLVVPGALLWLGVAE